MKNIFKKAIKSTPFAAKTRIFEIRQGGSPFATYSHLVQRYGERRVFLLESPGGPEVQRGRAFIGINPLLTIRLTGSCVSWLGNPLLVDILSNEAARKGLVNRVGQRSELIERAHVWDLLRWIRDQFLPSRDQYSQDNRGLLLGFFGYLGYDLASAIERLPKRILATDDVPDMDLAIYQAVIEYDLVNQTVVIATHDIPALQPLEVEPIVQAIRQPASRTDPRHIPNIPTPFQLTDSVSQDSYLCAVDKALKYIASGDIYQVQLGHELRVQSNADPTTVYARLRQCNPSPYCYIAPFGRRTALGASPELFLLIDRGCVYMKPIAGTCARGDSEWADKERIARMLSDEKECAEHIMLVDLCRNDIGKICRRHSLNVPSLMNIEQYSHVNHLVSTVTGRLRREYDEYDAITACFPAGTMTGAPKIRAMEIIEELETSRRGIYAGAVGLIGFSGDVEMALCIRGAVHDGSQFTYRASAGVVADSDPRREWAETFHKLAAVHWAITGKDFDHVRIAC